MKQLPYTLNTPVLRTDFSDDAAWKAVYAAIEAPADDGFGGEFQAGVTPIDDRSFEGFSLRPLKANIGRPLEGFGQPRLQPEEGREP